MNRPHKYADVIKHWADGGEIQYKFNQPDGKFIWVDEKKPDFNTCDESPIIEFRIKPETLRYRVALMRGATKHQIILFDSESQLLSSPYTFVKWLDDDWQEVEI